MHASLLLAELRLRSVSVTCHASGARTKWWLTRESGSLPQVCGDAECCSCEWSDVGELPAQAYLVVVLQGRGTRAQVAISRLSLRDARTVVSRVLPLWRQHRAGVGRAVTLANMLSSGAFSRGLYCACSVQQGACGSCKQASLHQRRWVWRNGFTGVYPAALCRWFTGLTDAVDIPAIRRATGSTWLSCSS